MASQLPGAGYPPHYSGYYQRNQRVGGNPGVLPSPWAQVPAGSIASHIGGPEPLIPQTRIGARVGHPQPPGQQVMGSLRSMPPPLPGPPGGRPPVPAYQLAPAAPFVAPVMPVGTPAFQDCIQQLTQIHSRYPQDIACRKGRQKRCLAQTVLAQVQCLYKSVAERSGAQMTMIEHGWFNYQVGCVLADCGLTASSRHYFLTCAGWLAKADESLCPAYSKKVSTFVKENLCVLPDSPRASVPEPLLQCYRLQLQAVVCLASQNASLYLHEQDSKQEEKHLANLEKTLAYLNGIDLSPLGPASMLQYQRAWQVFQESSQKPWDNAPQRQPAWSLQMSMPQGTPGSDYQRFMLTLEQIGCRYLARIESSKGEAKAWLQTQLREQITDQIARIERAGCQYQMSQVERGWLLYQTGVLLLAAGELETARLHFFTCAGLLARTDHSTLRYPSYNREISAFILQNTSPQSGYKVHRPGQILECYRLRVQGLVGLAEADVICYLSEEHTAQEADHLGNLKHVCAQLKEINAASFLLPENEQKYRRAMGVCSHGGR